MHISLWFTYGGLGRRRVEADALLFDNSECERDASTTTRPQSTRAPRIVYLAVDCEVKGGGDGAVVGAAQAVAHLVGQEVQLVPYVGQGVEEDAVGVGGDALAVALLAQHVRPAQPPLLMYDR